MSSKPSFEEFVKAYCQSHNLTLAPHQLEMIKVIESGEKIEVTKPPTRSMYFPRLNGRKLIQELLDKYRVEKGEE